METTSAATAVIVTIVTIPAIVTIVNDHMETTLKQMCFGLERIGIFPIIDSLDRLPYLRLSLAWFPYDRWRSLGSLVKCSAIVTIIWKPNFHFASDRQRSQRLPTIATITIAGIESESISAIVIVAIAKS